MDYFLNLAATCSEKERHWMISIIHRLSSDKKIHKTQEKKYRETCRGSDWEAKRTSHLVRGSILLAAASGRLLVVLAGVHHLTLGALSDQVPAHARDIFKTMTWWTRRHRKERKKLSDMENELQRGMIDINGVIMAEEWLLLYCSSAHGVTDPELFAFVCVASQQRVELLRLVNAAGGEKDVERDTGWHRYQDTTLGAELKDRWSGEREKLIRSTPSQESKSQSDI